jgi:hypothetical protein
MSYHDMEMLQYLITSYPLIDIESIYGLETVLITDAFKYQNQELLDYLLQSNIVTSELALQEASKYDNLEYFKTVHDTVLKMGPSSITRFSYSAKPATSKPWNPVTPDVLKEACKAGHLDIVKFVHDHLPDASVFSAYLEEAVKTGNVALIQFLCQNRMDASTGISQTFATACISGNLDIVKYLHETYSLRCDIDKGYEAALTGGPPEVARYLLDAGARGRTSGYFGTSWT